MGTLDMLNEMMQLVMGYTFEESIHRHFEFERMCKPLDDYLMYSNNKRKMLGLPMRKRKVVVSMYDQLVKDVYEKFGHKDGVMYLVMKGW